MQTNMTLQFFLISSQESLIYWFDERFLNNKKSKINLLIS